MILNPASGGIKMESVLSWLTGWQGTLQEEIHDYRELLWQARAENDNARMVKRENKIQLLLEAQSEIDRLLTQIF